MQYNQLKPETTRELSPSQSQTAFVMPLCCFVQAGVCLTLSLSLFNNWVRVVAQADTERVGGAGGGAEGLLGVAKGWALPHN